MKRKRPLTMAELKALKTPRFSIELSMDEQIEILRHPPIPQLPETAVNILGFTLGNGRRPGRPRKPCTPAQRMDKAEKAHRVAIAALEQLRADSSADVRPHAIGGLLAGRVRSTPPRRAPIFFRSPRGLFPADGGQARALVGSESAQMQITSLLRWPGSWRAPFLFNLA
ncbi:MAG: hypothetical protein ACLQO1_25770 [Steroidobacteraceae bacterium]